MQLVLGVTALSFSLPLIAAEITREQAVDLMTECQAQRQQEIAPLKAQAIDDCINVKRKDKDYCERFNENFGENRRTANGVRPGLFWDLPVCEEAMAAKRYFRQNPSRNVYKP